MFIGTVLLRRATVAAAMSGLVVAGLTPAASAADEVSEETVDVIHDFEAGEPGHIQWGAAGAGAQTLEDAGIEAYPGSGPNTRVLSYGFDLTAPGSFGGIGFEQGAGTPALDWSAYDGVQFWLHSDGGDGAFQVELMDAVDAQPGVTDRWDTAVEVGDAGWRLVRLPWDSFAYATDYQDAGAPNDGTLDLTHVRGLLLPAAAGAATVKIDDIALFATDGPVAPSVGVASTAVSVTEGDTAEVEVRLSRASEEDVTVDVATTDGTAVAGTDYSAAAGTLTIPAGERSATLAVETFGDDVVNGNRDLTVTVSNAVGATVGAATATVTIRDDDAPPASPLGLLHEVVEDFEGELVVGDPAGQPALGWFTAQGAGNVPSFARVGDDARPGASSENQALEVGFDTASWAVLIDTFTPDGTAWVPQDWSAYRGVGFWMEGTNSGAPLFVDLIDNRTPGSTVDDAERFTIRFADDFTGWRFVELPFEDFTRKNIGNGAPDDGLTLTEVHGIGIGVEQTPDPLTPTLRFDDVALVKHQQVVEDFEGELVLGDPAGQPALGWFTAQGAGNVPSFARVGDDARPGASSENQALEVGFDTSSWAVLIDTFTPDGTAWVPQDWSAYRGVGFWMEGTNSGAPLFVDLIDNRTPDSTVDDAERFTIRFADDFTGWRFVELPFEDFTRKNIGNGAPDDGLTLTEVHGIGIGVEQTPDPLTPTLRFDDLTLVGLADANRPLVINAARAIFQVTEGDTAQVELRLSRAAEEDVTVSFATAEAPDRTSTEDLPATADRDFATTSGEVAFPAGQTTAIIEIPTIDDDKGEVDETFLVRLSDPTGADLNPLAVPRVSIVDNDPDGAAEGLLDDFENGTGLLDPLCGATLSTREIAAEDADAYEGQSAYEHILDIEGDGEGGYAHAFAQPQDWSGRAGMGLWFQGQGGGDTVSVTVRDDAAAATGPDGWELAWSDEFDGEAGTPANPEHWTYETGGWGWGNDELQYYTDSTENAAHDGEGNMVITTRAVEDPEAAGLECWYGPCEYTSARLITENKVEFLHGRIEARAKLPAGEPGIWPAIWALGNDFRDVGWPRNGEIDIMEYVGKLPEEIFGTIHGPGYSGGNAWHATHDFGENLGGEWLTFAVEWEPESIRWSVQRDGGEEIEFHSATPADVAPSAWVFEHPFFLIMNMAVGGNFGGPLGEDLAFPQELAIDYIRVYQQQDSAERFTASFVDDAEGWRWVEIPFDAFARDDAQPEGAPDNGLTLTSVRGYEVLLESGAASLDRVSVLDEVTDPVDPAPGPDPEPQPDPGPVVRALLATLDRLAALPGFLGRAAAALAAALRAHYGLT